jgi:drug/metabolite transporter (DMT)-like permease
VTDDKGKAAVFTELSLVIAAVFWGSNYAVTKYAAGHLPQLMMVAFRFTVGGCCSFSCCGCWSPAAGWEGAMCSR